VPAVLTRLQTCLPSSDQRRQRAEELFGSQVTALVISGSGPELARAALAALLITAGHDGAWHRDWTDPQTAP
jgi:hypothetical protein